MSNPSNIASSANDCGIEVPTGITASEMPKVEAENYRARLEAFSEQITPEAERLEEAAAEMPGFEQLDQVASKTEEVIRKGGLITVNGHQLPDGDAIGSVMGMTAVLNQKAEQLFLAGEIDEQTFDSFQAVPINHHRAPPNLQMIPGSESILQVPDQNSAEDFSAWLAQDVESNAKHANCMAIAVDCGHLDRTGAVGPMVYEHMRAQGGTVVKIDHHEVDHHDPDSQFGDLNVYATTDAATVEVAYLASKMGVRVPEAGLQALATGYMTDSSFGARKDALSAAALAYIDASAETDPLLSEHDRAAEVEIAGQVPVSEHVVAQGGAISKQAKDALKGQPRTATEQAVITAGEDSLHTQDVELESGATVKRALAFVHVPREQIQGIIAESDDPGGWEHEVTWPLKGIPLKNSHSSLIGVTVFENPPSEDGSGNYKISLRSSHSADTDFPAMIEKGVESGALLAGGGHKGAAGLSVAADSLEEVHERIDPLLAGEVRRLSHDKQALEEAAHGEAAFYAVDAASGPAEKAIVGTILEAGDLPQKAADKQAKDNAKLAAKSLMDEHWKDSVMAFAALPEETGGYRLAVKGNFSYHSDMQHMVADGKEAGFVTEGRGSNRHQSASLVIDADNQEQLEERIGLLMGPTVAEAMAEKQALGELADAHMQDYGAGLAGVVVSQEELGAFHSGKVADAHKDLSYMSLQRSNRSSLAFTAAGDGDGGYDVIVRGSRSADLNYENLVQRGLDSQTIEEGKADNRCREAAFSIRADSDEEAGALVSGLLSPDSDGDSPNGD
jgi:nanoRNase/pAp phosphatase (c-di-AMP/oligoRNAs hydrolase)